MGLPAAASDNVETGVNTADTPPKYEDVTEKPPKYDEATMTAQQWTNMKKLINISVLKSTWIWSLDIFDKFNMMVGKDIKYNQSHKIFLKYIVQYFGINLLALEKFKNI